jgi:cell division protein FtsL
MAWINDGFMNKRYDFWQEIWQVRQKIQKKKEEEEDKSSQRLKREKMRKIVKREKWSEIKGRGSLVVRIRDCG